MNKNIALPIGIIGIILIGWLVLRNKGYETPVDVNSTSTPVTTSTGGTGSTRTAGAPMLVSSNRAIPTDTTVVLTGATTPNGASTNYWYEYGPTSALGSKTTSQSVGSGYVSIKTPAYIVGLTKDTSYYYRLVAENRLGKVVGDVFTFRTSTNTPAPVGSAPRTVTLAANAVGRTSANLRGEVTPNQADTEYWFEYGKTAELGNTSALVALGNGSAKLSASLTLSDLDPLTTYYFRINAQNQFGTVNGSILNFKTTGPAGASAPVATTRSATSVATSTAILRGTVNPNDADTTYWFEYSTDSLFGSVLLSSTGHQQAGSGTGSVSVEADLSGLTSNTTYYYRVVAQNNLGTTRGDRETFKTK
jgi:phosphodiesterase/alkaline phosphatase D-like protein